MRNQNVDLPHLKVEPILPTSRCLFMGLNLNIWNRLSDPTWGVRRRPLRKKFTRDLGVYWRRACGAQYDERWGVVPTHEHAPAGTKTHVQTRAGPSAPNELFGLR